MTGKRTGSNPAVKRILRWLEDNQWFIFIGLLIGTLGLGTWGFSRYAYLHNEKMSFWDCVYRSLQLLVLQSGAVSVPVPWQLEWARILAPLFGFYAGVRAFLAIFYERFQLLRIKRYQGHIVICGLGKIGWALAKKLRSAGKSVVVIEKDAENDLINPAKELGVKVLIGDATTAEMLKRAGTHRAKYLIVVSGTDDTNMAIAINAANLLKNYPKRSMTCLIHIGDPIFCQQLTWWWTVMKKGYDNCSFEFFDIFRSGTRALLQEYPAFDDKSAVDRCPPHIVIIGTGCFAQTVAEHLTRAWWNRHPSKDVNHKFKISLVGRDAETVRRQLRQRYPDLNQVCDLTGYNYEIGSAEFAQGEFLFDARGNCDVSRIYVCLEDSPRSFSTALLLRQLDIQLLGNRTIPIVAIVDFESETVAGEEVRTFGVLDKVCDPNALLNGNVLTIAKALYKAHFEYCQTVQFSAGKTEEIPEWEDVPKARQNAFIQAARSIIVNLQEIGCQVLPLVNWRLFNFARPEIDYIAEKENERCRQTGGPWQNYAELRKLIARLPVILARLDFEIHRSHYELLARKLHEDYCQTGLIVGESRPDYRKFSWNGLGDSGQNWYREKADRLIRNLWALCYGIKPVDEGGVTAFPLPDDVKDELCAIENENWNNLDEKLKKEQRDAVERFLAILAELNLQIYLDPIENIAQAMHRQWLDDQKRAGHTPATNPFIVSWNQLPEYKKDSNRKAARHIPVKLKAIGCEIQESKDLPPAIIEFTDEEIEKMAEMEHERWIEEQIDKGWTYGPVRSLTKKTNPYMVPWVNLSEKVKDWDRNQVKLIPKQLALINLQIIRKTEQARKHWQDYCARWGKIARAFHQRYREVWTKLGEKPESNRLLLDWEKLSEEEKKTVMRGAESLITIVRLAEFSVRKMTGPEAELYEFSPAEIERIAKIGYKFWFSEPECLIGWHNLRDELKEAAKNLARAIPEILAKGELEVYRGNL